MSEDDEPAAVVLEFEDGKEAGLPISVSKELLRALRVLAIDPMGLVLSFNRCYRQSDGETNMVPGWDITGLPASKLTRH